MPNVMGREFPYTAEGMAAAQQYSQAMGMRDGGMMGFRPIAMADAGDVEAKATARGFYDLMSSGTEKEIRQYIDENRTELETIAQLPDKMFNTLRDVLRRNPIEEVPYRQTEYGLAPGSLGMLTPGVFPMDNPQSEMMNRLGIANRIQDDIEAGIPTRGSASGPDLTGAELLSRLSPEEQALFIQQRNSAPVEMNRGGIMSLRGY